MASSIQNESEFGPHSYYRDSAGPVAVYPRAAGQMECDVCVVGGGFTGLSTALHLAEAGYSVVLLEAERIGWGASGRNGGQVINGYAKDICEVARQLGPEQSRCLWELSLEATQLLGDTIVRHGIDAEYQSGHLLAAVRPHHMTGLAVEQDALAGLGYTRSRLLDRDQVKAHVRSSRYHGGLLDEGGGHLHPLKYARGLAAAGARAGVRIFEKSRVLKIHPANGNGTGFALAVTEQGAVSARHLVLCCNAYLGALEPELRARIMPVGTYVIATEPLGGERALGLLPDNSCVSDTNFVLDYFRLSADWRLLFGGRVSYTTLPPAGLARRMRDRLVVVFPQLGEVAVTHAWGGFVDISRNRLPDVGRRPGNVYYAQGFSGHGVALTGLAGKVIGDAIRGDAEKFDVFARIPHQSFPGGPLLRMPLLILATLYSRLQDII
ncbi:MAG: FAD-binding oxidoreductase [Alphaproteobacteria bacterium]|nr:FAD-binding oxidoreductase [Alphaproteobacteria bacterium]